MPWSEATLGSVVKDARSGFASGASDDAGVFQVRMNNLTRDGSWDLAKRRRVPTSARQLNQYGLEPGDVLFNATNSPELVGKTALLTKLDEPMVFSNHFVRLRLNDKLVEPGYVTRWLQMHFTRRTFEGMCRQWVNQATVSRDSLLAMSMPLPPIEEQRRIADILDRADALRTKRREALTLLNDLNQSIFLKMFSGSHAEYPSCPLQDAFWFQEGPGVRKWQFRDHGIKLLNVGNIKRDGRLDLEATGRYLDPDEVASKYQHFLVDEGDLVIASSGVSFDSDGLLRTRGAFVKADDLPLCMNTSTIRFKAIDDRGSLLYLRAWINSPEFRRQITTRVTGSAQQNFGPSHLRALKIALPPPGSQQDFARRIADVEKQRGAQLRCAALEDALLESLQQRAFAGLL